MCHVLLNLPGISIIYTCTTYGKFYNKTNEERKFDEIIHTLQSNALLSRPTGLKLGYRHTYGP